MDTTARIEGGRLMISTDLESLIDNLTGAERLALVRALSLDEEVIAHVAEQITAGHVDGEHGSRSVVARAIPLTALDKARRRVAESSGEVARAEIAQLCERITRLESELREERMRWQKGMLVGRCPL